MPERTFFFAVMATVRTSYLKGVIEAAHKARFKGDEAQQGRALIMLKDSWLDELTKHPFISSKFNILTI